MQNDLTPASLSTLTPSRFHDVHTYNTRHNNAFPFPRTRTSLCASYFLQSTLKLWNYLPPEIKDWPSLSILKYILTSRVDHDKLPKYYYYGPRLTQILHARLRMRSSSLNEHLYIKNIIDSPNCFCGEIEPQHHYVFNVRNILVNEIVFFESYSSYWIFDLRKIYYYLAVQTLISIQILLFLRQRINIFRKVNDFNKIHKTRIHHVIFYLECNLQFPVFFFFL
jgi:hypothetical protein